MGYGAPKKTPLGSQMFRGYLDCCMRYLLKGLDVRNKLQKESLRLAKQFPRYMNPKICRAPKTLIPPWGAGAPKWGYLMNFLTKSLFKHICKIFAL